MKKISLMLFLGILALLISCSDDCEGDNPTVQLFNNGTGKADIQIKTSSGNTENINNIEPGSYSGERSFDPGKIEFTIAIQGVDNPIVYNLVVDFCTKNLVIIHDDNSVSSKSIRLDYF